LGVTVSRETQGGDETPMSTPGTPPTLETLCLRLVHLEQMLVLHREYQREQVETAYCSLKSKLEEMNKFREENKDLTLKFVTREWTDNQHDGMNKRITALEMRGSNFDGRLTGIALIIAGVFALFELALHWWKP